MDNSVRSGDCPVGEPGVAQVTLQKLIHAWWRGVFDQIRHGSSGRPNLMVSVEIIQQQPPDHPHATGNQHRYFSQKKSSLRHLLMPTFMPSPIRWPNHDVTSNDYEGLIS
nr:hypothetical protein [Arthrobacter sp. ISL-72]